MFRMKTAVARSFAVLLFGAAPVGFAGAAAASDYHCGFGGEIAFYDPPPAFVYVKAKRRSAMSLKKPKRVLASAASSRKGKAHAKHIRLAADARTCRLGDDCFAPTPAQPKGGNAGGWH